MLSGRADADVRILARKLDTGPPTATERMIKANITEVASRQAIVRRFVDDHRLWICSKLGCEIDKTVLPRCFRRRFTADESFRLGRPPAQSVSRESCAHGFRSLLEARAMVSEPWVAFAPRLSVSRAAWQRQDQCHPRHASKRRPRRPLRLAGRKIAENSNPDFRFETRR